MTRKNKTSYYFSQIGNNQFKDQTEHGKIYKKSLSRFHRKGFLTFSPDGQKQRLFAAADQDFEHLNGCCRNFCSRAEYGHCACIVKEVVILRRNYTAHNHHDVVAA